MGQYSISGFTLAGNRWDSTTMLQNVPIAMLEIIAGPGDAPTITEIGFFSTLSSGATPTPMCLAVPAAAGVAPRFMTMPAAQYDPLVAPSLVQVATDWQIAPTPPASGSYFRRLDGSGNVNLVSGIPVWMRFPRGLTMAPGSSMVMFYIPPGAAGAWVGMEYWIEWDVLMSTYLTSGYFTQSQVMNTTGTLASPTPIVEIIASPTDRPVITEIGVMATATVGGLMSLGLGIPPVKGQSPYVFGEISRTTEDTPPTRPQIMVAVAWRVGPSAPAKYLRRASLSPISGSYGPHVWRFPRGICIAENTSLALYNVSSGSFHFTFGEYWVEWDN